MFWFLYLMYSVSTVYFSFQLLFFYLGGLFVWSVCKNSKKNYDNMVHITTFSKLLVIFVIFAICKNEVL